MTINQMDMILALHKCTFLPGSFDKRFVKTLFKRVALDNTVKPLTERQGKYLAQLFHKYRKQIGGQDHNLYCELCQKAIEQVEMSL